MNKSPNSSQLQVSGHIPALDGLRGIAILMVLTLHFYNEGIINTGYPLIGPVITKIALSGLYGIELFFVISGFVITRMLLISKNDPRYFRNFYMSRFLRIVPLYYLILFLIFQILPHLISFDQAAKEIATRQIWLWTFLSNAPWSGGGWDDSALFRLVHFWFLCVVVHYYIVWPVVIHKYKVSTIVRICFFGMLFSFLIKIIYGIIGGPILFAWSSISKLDGLFLGSLIALGFRSKSTSRKITKCSLRTAWLAGLIFSMLIFVPRRLHTGFYLAVIEIASVIFSGGLLIQVLLKATPLRVMENTTLITFGKYSYGIFIIHFIFLPLFHYLFEPGYLSEALGSPLLAQAIFYILTISISFTLAFASWHLYESHFINLKRFF